MPRYDLMLRVHDALAARAVPLTVLCPTNFMDNWSARYAMQALVNERIYRYPHCHHPAWTTTRRSRLFRLPERSMM
ncbi:hypothetical protein [Salinibacterium sp. ZJ454]|uniref:hypothetical protein n=1 Tax=Salinibacterium sp. ZJ454 TaxID=2708339 RepID=UPI0014220968|nr:hypothetical protein [Salinibacterium sp. ZJ454]